jgi:hypothetical protein
MKDTIYFDNVEVKGYINEYKKSLKNANTKGIRNNLNKISIEADKVINSLIWKYKFNEHLNKECLLNSCHKYLPSLLYTVDDEIITNEKLHTFSLFSVVFKKHMENMIYRNRNVRTTKKDLII